MRLLHTLKGTSAIFGLMSFASACHEIESEALDAGRELPPHAVDRLRAAWEEAAASLHRVCGDTGEARIEVRRSEHTQLLEAIARGAPRPQLAETLATWRMDLAEKHLARFAEEARVVASRLGKEVVVSIKANGLRLDARAWAPVWRVFTHVVRNAVNHGVENVEERLAASKPKAGRISLSTDMRGEVIALELADDGAGIRWERLAERARAAGLPSETREDLVEALFADGVSTQSEVTEVAGRGVGLSAVREQVRKLGGDVLVTSEPGRGTRFRIELPLATMLGADTETALRSFAPSMAPAA